MVGVVLQKPFDFLLNETIALSKDCRGIFAATNTGLSGRWARYCKFVELENIFDMASGDSVNG